MQNSKSKKGKAADYNEISEEPPLVNEPVATYSTIGKSLKKRPQKQEDPYSLEEYYDELEDTMADAEYMDDETALANAVSMETMLNWVLEDIHEFFKNQKDETNNNISTKSKKIL
ncbi:MAG: hypothetical protein IK004_07725 [Bacteroidales bacterium]|nr:hypothetical protein [Bacteroidales bacterium]